jgi:hypothetical protein
MNWSPASKEPKPNTIAIVTVRDYEAAAYPKGDALETNALGVCIAQRYRGHWYPWDDPNAKELRDVEHWCAIEMPIEC